MRGNGGPWTPEKLELDFFSLVFLVFFPFVLVAAATTPFSVSLFFLQLVLGRDGLSWWSRVENRFRGRCGWLAGGSYQAFVSSSPFSHESGVEEEEAIKNEQTGPALSQPTKGE